MLLVALVAVVGPAPVVAAEPPGAGCPTPAEVTAALARQALPQGAAAWRLHYAVGPTAGDGPARLTLDLSDAAGSVRLRRELAIEAQGCAAAAASTAIIVERFFRGLDWTADTPLPEPQPAPPAADATPPATAMRRAAALPGAAPHASAATAWPGLILRAGAGVAWTRGAAAQAALDADVALAGPLLLSLGVAVPPDDTVDAVGAGTVRERAVPIHAGVQAAVVGGAWRLTAGPDALLALGWAEAAQLPHQASRLRGVLSLGAAGSLAFRLSPRWALVLEAGVHVRTTGSPLVVQGWGEVLRPPLLRAATALQIAYLLP